MKLVIDRDKCQGHGRCAYFAPELFDLDDEGHGVVLRDATTDEDLDRARAAIGNCPERAITGEA